VTRQFIQACSEGDIQGLLSLLAPDVVARGDGGGKVYASPRPIYGAERVGRLLAGALRLAPPSVAYREAEVNAHPAMIIYIAGQPFGVMSFDIAEGHVQAIYSVMNPDKLRDVPPLAPA
jgi:RNA polymerase sigma-70 factor (ECF subfamily)